MLKIIVTYNSYDKEEEKIVMEVIDILEKRIEESTKKGKELGIDIDYRIE